MERATFGAGCFWGVEAAFRKVKGVFDTEVGYMGGAYDYPSHEDVCEDRTGHAEVVQVRFDPKQVSYEDLLAVFWSIHDPTRPDQTEHHGAGQHRSAIFCHTPDQMRLALASRTRMETRRATTRPLLTEVQPASAFWRAESHHQRRLERDYRAAIRRGLVAEARQEVARALSPEVKPAWLFM